LLQEWPQAGPKLVWQVGKLGGGYSTPSIVGDRIYLMTNQGLEDEFVKALDARDGKEVWATRVGTVGNPRQEPPYPGSRSTPTVDGNSIYALGSDGDLVCLETATGKIRWQKSLRKDLAGVPGM
jgi:outer membrane protein assembly factor BamB